MRVSVFYSLSVLTILWNNYSCAQSYIPVPDTLAAWNETHWVGGMCEDYHENSYQLQTDGSLDTLGYVYTRLTKFNHNVVACSPSYGFYTQGVYTTPSGYFRNDTTGRVYYRTDFQHAEILLYDFNVSVGDTVQWDTTHFTGHKVYAIDSVLVDNTYRKQIHFCGFSSYDSLSVYSIHQVIEGIGSNRGFLIGMNWSFPGEGDDKLKCFSVNNTTLWGNLFYNCQLTSGIKEIPSFTIRVYPIPVADKLNIELTWESPKPTTVTIYDMVGKLIKQMQTGEARHQILTLTTQGMAKGMYLLEANSSPGKIVRSFVVE